MTATEELRRMLDERGVEWHGDIATYWRDADAVESLFADNALDVSLYAISPEQAVEATLGRGTCRLEREPDSDRLWWCSNCRSYHEHVSEFPWEYCPRCGAKVVD